MTQLKKIEQKISDALRKNDYAKVFELNKQKKVLMQAEERTSLAKILPEFSEQEKIEALRKMHKVFVLSDLLYGAALDFQSYLNRFDSTIEIQAVKEAEKAVKILHNITKNIDDLNNEEMSSEFGDFCDNLNLIIENSINKQFIKSNKHGK